MRKKTAASRDPPSGVPRPSQRRPATLPAASRDPPSVASRDPPSGAGPITPPAKLVAGTQAEVAKVELQKCAPPYPKVTRLLLPQTGGHRTSRCSVSYLKAAGSV